MAIATTFPKRIKIVNAAVGVGWTNRKSARRYVDQGRAIWTSPARVAIQFHIADLRHQAVQRKVYEDGEGVASLKAIKGLPITGDPIQLFTRLTRGRRAARGRSGPVKRVA